MKKYFSVLKELNCACFAKRNTIGLVNWLQWKKISSVGVTFGSTAGELVGFRLQFWSRPGWVAWPQPGLKFLFQARIRWLYLTPNDFKWYGPLSINGMARSYTFLIMPRFIAGLSIAGTINLVPIRIGEISEKSIRGIFLALDRIGINVGCFLITTLEDFLPYKTMNLVMNSLPIVAICLFPFMTETPYYYLLKGQDEKAITTQIKLSGVTRW